VQASTSPRTALGIFTALAFPGTVRLGAVGEPVQRLATGLPSLDAVLDGGLPRGRLSEIIGSVTSGKTALLLAFLAAATRRGEATALIDLPGSLHPAVAQAAGVELTRLLWVRPSSLKEGLRCAELILEAGGFGFVAIDLGKPIPWQLRTPLWPRLARAAEHAGTTVAITASHRVAGSFAALSLRISVGRVLWSRGAWPLFEGIQSQLTVARNKLGAPGRSIGLQVETSPLAGWSSPLFESSPSDLRLLPFAF
jgi:hypothetical protein